MQYVETLKRVISLLKSRQLITFELINISENSELTELFLQKAEDRLIKMRYGDLIESDKALIITALSLIAFKNYDGNFWSHVHNQFKRLYGDRYTPSQNIDGEIRNILRPFITQMYTQSTLIGWVILHSIVPEYYIVDFYNILSIVYLYDLRCQIPDDPSILEGLLKTIFKQIAKQTIQDNDNIQSKVMNQSYKFIRSTREVVTTNIYRNTLATFARLVVMSIASKVNYNEVRDDIPKFFVKWAEYWFNTSGKNQIENRRKSASITDSIIKWKVDFGIENQKLVLFTKTIFLSPEIDHKQIKIEILSNNKRVYFNERPRILENDMSYELSTHPITVDFDPFNIKIIIHGTDMKPEELINDSFLFNIETGKRVTSRLTDYTDLYIISKSFDSNNIVMINENEHFKLGVLDTTKLEYFTVNNHHKSLKESVNPYLIGDLHNQISFNVGEFFYEVYYNNISYHFTPSNEISEYRLWINRQFMILNKVLEGTLKDIPHTLLVDGLNEIYLTHENNIKIPNSRIVFYYDKNLRFEQINEKIIFYSSRFTIELTEKNIDEFIRIECLDGNSFILNPYIPMVKDQSKSYKPILDYLWHADFSFYEKISFKGIDATYLLVKDDTGTTISSKIYGNRDKLYGVIFEIQSTLLKTTNKNFIFSFFKKDDLIYTTQFINTPIMESGKISLVERNESEVIYKVDNIIGKGNFSVEIFIDNKHFKSELIKSFPFEYTLKNYGTHNYTFELIHDRQILDKKQLFCIDLSKLENTMMKISQIQVLTKAKKNSQFMSSTQNLRRCYLKITEYLGDNNFNGEIIIHEKTGEYIPFEVIDTVDIYIDLPITDRKAITALITTFDGEALYYDKNSFRILDTDSEPLSSIVSTIDEYTLEIGDYNEEK